MAVKICPNCNRSYPEDAFFCKYCGIQLEEAWEEYEEAVTPGGAKCRCPSCGAAVYEEEKVCRVCGYQVGKAGWIKDEKPEQENNNKNININKNKSKALVPVLFIAGGLLCFFALALALGLFSGISFPGRLTSGAINERASEASVSLEETPAPVTETPAPAAQTPAPAQETQTPVPETPTPAPAAETPAPAAETPAPAPEEQQPGNAEKIDPAVLDSIVKQCTGAQNYAISIVDMNTGAKAGTANKNANLSSSVLIDIPIMYTIAKKVDEGAMSLDDTVTFQWTAEGRGILGRGDAGKNYSIKELVGYMFRFSDNNATNSLLDHLGMSTICDVCHTAGYPSVTIVNHIGSTTDNTGSDNFVSAEDVSGMLYELYNDKYALGRSFLQENMHVTDSQSNPGLGRNISPALFMNINGLKTDKYNEAAIVDDGRTVYAITFLGNGDAMESLQNAAAAVGQHVYDTMKQG